MAIVGIFDSVAAPQGWFQHDAPPPGWFDESLLEVGAAGGAYTLTALGGSYALTGQSATLLRSKRIVASGGAYAVAGASAALLRSKRLIASGGAYAWTGASAGLSRNRRLTAQGGSYTYTGANAVITRVGMVWPDPSQVLSGVSYGPTGVEYTGTFQGLSMSLKLDLTTGMLVKPLNDKTVLSL